MPDDGSNNGPAEASKRAGRASRTKGEDRQARLAEALRANLRRRKAPNSVHSSARGSASGSAADKKDD